MIRPRDYHPQANVLIRAHHAANAQRFAGTEADSTHPAPWFTEPTQPPEGWRDTGDSRFPRTLTEAFGPYTSPHIDEEPEPSRAGTLGYAVLLVAAMAGLGILLAWRG